MGRRLESAGAVRGVRGSLFARRGIASLVGSIGGTAPSRYGRHGRGVARMMGQHSQGNLDVQAAGEVERVSGRGK